MTKKSLVWSIVAATVIAAPILARQGAQRTTCCAPAINDMPVNGGNLGNQRYSSLDKINRQNIQNLGAAWRIDVSAVAPATKDIGSETTPVVVNGIIYLNTPSGGVIAVDGATGASKWKWQPGGGGPGRGGGGGGGNHRGVSVGEG